MTTKKTEKKAKKAKSETVKKTKTAKPAKKTATEEKKTVEEQPKGTIQEDLTAFLKPFSENDFSDDDLKKVKAGVAKLVKKHFPPSENHTFTEVYIPKNEEMSNTLMVLIGFRKLEDASFNVFNCAVKLNGKKK